ncbi:hypothetical protein [Planctomyces sp. SH-PL14]|uniref:hypothetical protein n=1 Tax=Planctomyces sp. SH-PL14 TaxID=1632864 RepID=UPI00078D6C57|nr:hypothetical protein [Planctomyces sp. SH-PL14]AMV20137.1 hypothetical protein VT03_19735 [Planctomyces sp. SH-PL14]
MRSISMGIGTALLLAGALSLRGAERNGAAEKPVASQTANAAIMRAKLASTQKIVEGLLANDFALIERGGDELDRIGHSEAWAAAEDQVYAHYRNELQRQAVKISRLGQERNLDGASYAYMHLLTACIGCHSHCRDVLHVATRIPRLEAPPKSTGSATTVPPAREP